MLEGVKYMHNSGLVHVDLKPGLLLLRRPTPSHEDLCIAVWDFGMTKCEGYPLRHAVKNGEVRGELLDDLHVHSGLHLAGMRVAARMDMLGVQCSQAF
jgi:serine/threonine protein kinase